MRILVTGGTGFVGRHLLRELRGRNRDVLLFARSSSDITEARELGCEVFVGDLTDFAGVREAVAAADAVIHVGEIGLSLPDATARNVSLVREMLAAARSSGLRRFVLVSSVTTVAPPSACPADEDTEPLANHLVDDAYTRYKRGCEQAVFEAGQPATIIRGSTIYGPGAHYLVWFVRWARRMGRLGLPFPGRIDVRLPTVHVADVAQILATAVDLEGDDVTVYNAADDCGTTPADFVRRLAELCDMPMRLRQTPLVLQRAAAAVLDAMQTWRAEPPLAGGVYDFLTHDAVFSNRRLKTDLNLRLRYPSIQEGLPETVAWLRDHIT
ncbi:MAG: NAD-dependent epimerase/dehydratase family protein [Candidatus Lernaella stagnicola]|nr:NAD-dependent epimerase/dehydratase family protein [Candidatus Lernaella stagnicola]